MRAPLLGAGDLACQRWWTWQQYVGHSGLHTHAESADAGIDGVEGAYPTRKCWAHSTASLLDCSLASAVLTVQQEAAALQRLMGFHVISEAGRGRQRCSVPQVATCPHLSCLLQVGGGQLCCPARQATTCP